MTLIFSGVDDKVQTLATLKMPFVTLVAHLEIIVIGDMNSEIVQRLLSLLG